MDNPENLPYRSRKPLGTELLTIVNALLACDYMQKRERRDTVLDLLNAEVQGITDGMGRRDDNKADVLEIVMTCSKHTGALEKLAEIVIELEGHTATAAQQLHALMHKLFISLVIDVQLFDKLMDLLIQIQVTKVKIKSIYHRSIPLGGNSDFSRFQQYDVIQTLLAIARELAWFGWQSDGTHPLVKYVELLSRYIPDPLKVQFDEWCDQIIQKSPKRTVSRIDHAHPLQGAFFLLVTFQPDCNRQDHEPERFYVRANFIREERGKNILVDGYVEEDTHLLAEIPALLDRWILDCEGKKARGSPFAIELFLPFELLHSTTCDPHKWQLKDEFGNLTPIMQKYPLVVRSYNRVYEGGTRVWNAWEENWGICRSGKCCMYISESSENGEDNGVYSQEIKQCLLQEEVYYRQNEYLHISLQEVRCLRMTFVPPSFDDASQHIFKKMMGAGTSVALWPRSKEVCPDNGALERMYDTLLPGCDLSRLPERLWKLRRKSELSLANHITLFWDDPNRVPADSPYKPDKELLIAPKGSKP